MMNKKNKMPLYNNSRKYFDRLKHNLKKKMSFILLFGMKIGLKLDMVLKTLFFFLFKKKKKKNFSHFQIIVFI